MRPTRKEAAWYYTVAFLLMFFVGLGAATARKANAMWDATVGVVQDGKGTDHAQVCIYYWYSETRWIRLCYTSVRRLGPVKQ